MIRNKRQYNEAKGSVEEFRAALVQARATGPADGVHPLMFQAYLDGMESQIETLSREMKEYDLLCNGDVSSIELRSLEDLPLGLIKARIAQGVTQQDLADKLGVKAQQIQRWEAEDYEGVGFRRLIQIANALDLNISEHIQLPKKPKDALTELRHLGIDKSFILARLAANDDSYDTPPTSDHELISAAAPRLKKIYGISFADIGLVVEGCQLQAASGGGRFKVPVNADAGKVQAYSAYAHYLASLIADADYDKPSSVVPRTWRELKYFLCGDNPPTFETLLRGAWSKGIAVLPLADPINFHGACWRINGRNVVVLRQATQYASRWAFALLHEIYHAGESPELNTLDCIDIDVTESSRRESEDEANANQIAGDVLLNGRTNELYEKVILAAERRPERLKMAVKKVAAYEDVDVAHLANYIAYRVKEERSVNWWGAANNLQRDDEQPMELARKVLLENVQLWRLEEDDRRLLEQALKDPSLR
jgi:transcriptional regulator with XRE-family HTH domain